jgi:hypothetical protein
VRFEDIPPETARQQMQAFLPPLIVEVLLEFWRRATKQPALV